MNIIGISPYIAWGWVLGIVVNYLSDILPIRRRISRPVCWKCQSSMELRNYFFWPRKCNNCGSRRKLRVLLVEVILILASVLLIIFTPERLGYLTGMLLLAYFGVITVIDLEHRLILHMTSVAGVVLGLLIGVWLHGFWATVLGGLSGFGVMLAFYYLGIAFVKLMAKVRHHTPEETEGLGFGDVNLGGVIGLLLGFPGVFAGLVISILLAGVASFGIILVTRLQKTYDVDLSIPYGPFLVLGATFLLYIKDWFM